VTDNDRLCYRMTNEGKDDWGEWHEIKHGKGSQREVHRITLP